MYFGVSFFCADDRRSDATVTTGADYEQMLKRMHKFPRKSWVMARKPLKLIQLICNETH